MLCCWFCTTTLTTSPSSSSIVALLLPALDAPPPALAQVAWAISCSMLKSLFTFFLSMICAVILFAVPSDPLRSDVVKVHPLKREDAREQEGVWEICSMTNPDCTSLVKHNFQNHFVANVLPLPDLFCHFLPYLVLLIICLLSEDAVKVHPLKREDTREQEGVWEICSMTKSGSHITS